MAMVLTELNVAKKSIILNLYSKAQTLGSNEIKVAQWRTNQYLETVDGSNSGGGGRLTRWGT